MPEASREREPGICYDVVLALIRDRIAIILMRNLKKIAPSATGILLAPVKHVKRVRLLNPNVPWLSTLVAFTAFITIVIFKIPRTSARRIVVPKDVLKVRRLLSETL